MILDSILVLVVGGLVVESVSDSNFRRDFYLNESLYPEGTWAPIPKEGGRIQVVSSVAPNMTLAQPLKVDFGGFTITLDPNIYPDNVPTNGLDWVHSQYNPTTGSLFTSLHIHDDLLIQSISKLAVTDATGLTVIDDKLTVNMDESDIQVTYVTTRNNYRELVIHLHNYGINEQEVNKVVVNGVIDIDPFTLRDGEHVVKIVDSTMLDFKETDVWTVVVYWDNESAGYGGRLNKELFPIEDWPKSSQCPFPVEGANKDNFKILREELSINTHFLGGDCDADDGDIMRAAANSKGEWFVLPEFDHWKDGEVPDDAYDGIAAAFLGDESDSSLESSWEVWSRALTVQQITKDKYAVYDGGHSNHLNGAFSGVADIQGMDFYVACCAPHITTWGSTMRIQGAYDYLRTARDNHKPLTTWLYSQGWCEDCWHVKDQNSGELLVQLGSVVAAGGKGLMLFQSDVRLSDGGSWSAGGKFLKSVSLIKEFLRQADPEGARYSSSSDHAITEVLGGPTSLLIIAISTRASGYNDKTCAVTGQHWTFEEEVISSIDIEIPSYLEHIATDAGKSVSEFYFMVEVKNGEYNDDPSDVKLALNDDEWSISNLKLGTAGSVVRMFMLLPK